MTDEEAHDNAMDEGIAALADTSSRLIAAVEDLGERLNTTERMQKQLTTQQNELRETQRSQRTQRGINMALAISLIFDIILSVAVGFGYFRIDGNAQDISEIQDRTSRQVLCPLYQLLVDQSQAVTPEELEELSEKEKEEFKETVRVITQGYQALDCQKI